MWFGVAPSPWHQPQRPRRSRAQRQVDHSPCNHASGRADRHSLPADATATAPSPPAAATASPRRPPLARASALLRPTVHPTEHTHDEGGNGVATRPSTTTTSTGRRVTAVSKSPPPPPQEDMEKDDGANSNNPAVPESVEVEMLAAELELLVAERKTFAAANASKHRAFSSEHEYPPLEYQLQPENLVGHTSGVCSVIAGDDRYIVSCSMDRSVKVWSRSSFACMHTLFGHADNVSCVDLNARWLVSGSHDTTLRVYSCVAGFKLLHVLSGHTAYVTKAHLPAAQPQRIVSCSDDATIRVWNGELGFCHTLVLSGSNDGTIQIFNFLTAEYVGCLDHVHSPVYSMCLLPSGQLLCSTGDGRLLHFSDLYSHPLVKSELRLASKWISMLQLCGQTVVCSSDDLLYIVDAEQLQVLAVIESNHGFVNSVSWLHAKALISGGQDNVVKVWNIA